MTIPDIRPLELLALWSELDDAYHGKNGYGGDTAELYAYRFDTYSPSRHGSGGHAGNPTVDSESEANTDRTHRLFDLLSLFANQRNCVVSIQETRSHGRKIGRWVLAMRFDHRVHVRIKRRT